MSAEWMVPKALWLQQKEPHVFEAAATICEYQVRALHAMGGQDVMYNAGVG